MRLPGFEPRPQAWGACILPLDESRFLFLIDSKYRKIFILVLPLTKNGNRKKFDEAF